MSSFDEYYMLDVSLAGRNSDGRDERKRARETERGTDAPPLPALFLYPQRQRAKISGTKTHVTLAISVRGAT